MPIVDLTGPTSTPVPGTGLDSLPRRVTLTRRELAHLATVVCGAPLSFEVPAVPRGGHPAGRPPEAGRDGAHADVLASLPDPVDSLHRRGLLIAGTPDREVRSTFGVLAAPQLALDLDVVVGAQRARTWHRQSGEAVATLSTVDGVVFELAWLSTAQWAGELAQVACLPEPTPVADSRVPAVLDLPFALLEAAGEAVRLDRADLLPRLVADHGHPLEVVPLLTALLDETHGRLRGLAADVPRAARPVGVVAWVLLTDGWRALSTHSRHGVRRLRLTRVTPADLPTLLAPVLARVVA